MASMKSAPVVLLFAIAMLAAAPAGAELQAHWSFEEGSAGATPAPGAPEGVFAETSGRGAALDAGMLGGGQYQSDVPAPFAPGLSLFFDGSDDRAFARPGLVPTSKLETPSVTVEAWVKPAGTGSGMIFAYSPRGFAANGRGYYLHAGVSGVTFAKGDGDLSFDLAGGGTLVDGQWHHIAGSYQSGAGNTGRIRVFVDGVEVADVQEDAQGPGGIV
jgi:hypothetical protein